MRASGKSSARASTAASALAKALRESSTAVSTLPEPAARSAVGCTAGAGEVGRGGDAVSDGSSEGVWDGLAEGYPPGEGAVGSVVEDVAGSVVGRAGLGGLGLRLRLRRWLGVRLRVRLGRRGTDLQLGGPQPLVLGEAAHSRGDAAAVLAVGGVARVVVGVQLPAVQGTACALILPHLEVYLGYLETVFLVRLVPAWASSRTTALTRTPKVHLTDTGLAAALLHLDEAGLAAEPARAGPLLESFVVTELVRQLAAAGAPVELSHLRTRDGREVDVVLQSRDGRVAAVEVKAGTAVRGQDAGVLRWLAGAVGDRFVQGVVLYAGDRVVALDDRTTLLPISAVWARTGADAGGGVPHADTTAPT